MPEFAEIYEQLRRIDLMPILLSLLLGGLIGLEREVHGRPAGVRTHMLVCMCSTILVHAAARFVHGPGQGSIVFDPQRLAAGIVTGIGFLGAAAVVRAGDMVRGITTGACVWSVAGLGIVIGQGAYGVAVVATVAFLTILIVVDRFTAGIKDVIYRRLTVRGRTADLQDLVDRLAERLRGQGMRLQDVSGRRDGGGGGFEIVLHVRCRQLQQAPRVLEEITGFDGVESAEWSMPIASP